MLSELGLTPTAPAPTTTTWNDIAKTFGSQTVAGLNQIQQALLDRAIENINKGKGNQKVTVQTPPPSNFNWVLGGAGLLALGVVGYLVLKGKRR